MIGKAEGRRERKWIQELSWKGEEEEGEEVREKGVNNAVGRGDHCAPLLGSNKGLARCDLPQRWGICGVREGILHVDSVLGDGRSLIFAASIAKEEKLPRG